MKRMLVVVAAGFLLTCLFPHGAWPFGVKDVVAMSREGFPDSLIIGKIRHGDTRFDLDARDFHALKEAGVSDDVVMAMLRTEDRFHAGAYQGGYYWPYYSPSYADLDFGFYDPTYWAHAPIFVGRGFGYRGYGRFGHGSRRR